jgi:hypothetical protein
MSAMAHSVDWRCPMKLIDLLSVLVLAAPAVLNAGCVLGTDSDAGRVCTKIGYDNGLRVRVEVPPEPAAYRLEVEAEGDTLSLDYDVSSNQVTRCRADCEPEGRRIQLRGSVSAQPELVALVELRGAQTGPDEAAVRIYREAALVAEASFKPRYETAEPNGPGCGVHTFALAKLVVP